jgi:hypothetical protein
MMTMASSKLCRINRVPGRIPGAMFLRAAALFRVLDMAECQLRESSSFEGDIQRSDRASICQSGTRMARFVFP